MSEEAQLFEPVMAEAPPQPTKTIVKKRPAKAPLPRETTSQDEKRPKLETDEVPKPLDTLWACLNYKITSPFAPCTLIMTSNGDPPRRHLEAHFEPSLITASLRFHRIPLDQSKAYWLVEKEFEDDDEDSDVSANNKAFLWTRNHNVYPFGTSGIAVAPTLEIASRLMQARLNRHGLNELNLDDFLLVEIDLKRNDNPAIFMLEYGEVPPGEVLKGESMD